MQGRGRSTRAAVVVYRHCDVGSALQDVQHELIDVHGCADITKQGRTALRDGGARRIGAVNSAVQNDARSLLTTRLRKSKLNAEFLFAMNMT